jgi:hypothetical protein
MWAFGHTHYSCIFSENGKLIVRYSTVQYSALQNRLHLLRIQRLFQTPTVQGATDIAWPIVEDAAQGLKNWLFLQSSSRFVQAWQRSFILTSSITLD